MTNVQISGLMRAHRANRRAANEQSRELAHLRRRAYRGVPVTESVKGEEIHGNFTYRGRSYTK